MTPESGRTSSAGSRPTAATKPGARRLLDLPAPGQPGRPVNTMEPRKAGRKACQTGLRDRRRDGNQGGRGTVDVVSEGHWKLLHALELRPASASQRPPGALTEPASLVCYSKPASAPTAVMRSRFSRAARVFSIKERHRFGDVRVVDVVEHSSGGVQPGRGVPGPDRLVADSSDRGPASRRMPAAPDRQRRRRTRRVGTSGSSPRRRSAGRLDVSHDGRGAPGDDADGHVLEVDAGVLEQRTAEPSLRGPLRGAVDVHLDRDSSGGSRRPA